MLYELTVKEFILTTASKEPVPGGGSVSALCGSLSASLAKMVAGLTVGKKNYEAVNDKMQEVVEKMPAFIDRLMQAIQEDSNSFDTVMAAFRLPKDTEEQKAARRDAINCATKSAAEVPLKTAQMVAETFDTLAFVAENGNKNAMSDIAVATMLARTAVFGALYNVKINLSGLPDDDYKKETQKEVERLHNLAENREKEILSKITL
jgi:formiminotetrahydrofolate cyclodeaminase